MQVGADFLRGGLAQVRDFHTSALPGESAEIILLCGLKGTITGTPCGGDVEGLITIDTQDRTFFNHRRLVSFFVRLIIDGAPFVTVTDIGGLLLYTHWAMKEEK